MVTAVAAPPEEHDPRPLYVLVLEEKLDKLEQGLEEVRGWLSNPDWPTFGPGIGPGPGDPGRMAARLAVSQAIEVIGR